MNHDPGDASRGADEEQGAVPARPGAPGEPPSVAAGGFSRAEDAEAGGADAVRESPGGGGTVAAAHGPGARGEETGGDAHAGDAHGSDAREGDTNDNAASEPSWRPPGTAPADPPGTGRDTGRDIGQDMGADIGEDAVPDAGRPWGGEQAAPGPSGPGSGGSPAPAGAVPGAWGFPAPGGQPYASPYAGAPYTGGPHAGGPFAGASYAGGPYAGAPFALPYAAPAEPEEPRPPMRWTWRAAVGLTLIALAAGALGGGVGAWSVDRDDTGVTLRQPAASQPERPRDSVAGLAATTLPGVVYIHASKGGQQATGTGFVLDGNGYILTNNHVVADAADGGSIRVVFNAGEQVEARVVGRDAGYDLAVIRVENVRGLVPLPLGDSDTAQVGDPVIAIGAPYNLEGTVTSGIISAKDRAVSAGGSGEDASYFSALQTDAPINPGNSGGPLIDASGRVIGVNTAIRSAGGGSESDPFGTGSTGSIGLGFAIPINQAKRVAQQLIDDGRAVHPVIGVTLDTRYEGVGARVADGDKDGRAPVRSGGPADRAGVRPGDVVTAIDGRKVADANELIVAVRSGTPGQTIHLTIQRDGSEVTLPLTLEGETG